LQVHFKVLTATTAEHEPVKGSPQSISYLFRDLHDMFSSTGKAFSAQEISAYLAESIRQLRNNVTRRELIALRDITGELASQLDELIRVRKAATAARIASGELISAAQLQQALGVKRRAIKFAHKVGRIFAIVGSTGEDFYPRSTQTRHSTAELSSMLQNYWAAFRVRPSIASSQPG
jgi:hypothetical protein